MVTPQISHFRRAHDLGEVAQVAFENRSVFWRKPLAFQPSIEVGQE